MIAIGLSTTACFFLLSFESSLIMKTKTSIQNLEKEALTGQASVLLFEKLYTHQIDWETVFNQKSYEVLLEPSGWTATYTFKNKNPSKKISPDVLFAEATISLHKGDSSFENVAQRPLFLKKEEGINAAL
jgi:hypothetical protein